MRTRPLLMTLAAAVFCASASAGPAAAQPSDTKAAAEQLFTQGRALMDKGDHAAACPKFEASLKLDPALGTLLNLADCYEKIGRLASAWANYREAATLAARQGQARREQVARQRATALEPRLPRLVIKVAEGGQVPGLVITRDGATVEQALLDTPVYVDAGKHQVAARAPGYKAVSIETTTVEAEEAVVEIPVLEPAPQDGDGGQATGQTENTGSTGQGADFSTTGIADGSSRDRDTAGAGKGRRITGLALGGAGIVSLGVGLGLGLSAKSTWDDAFDSGLCDRDTLECTDEGQEKTDSARTRATISTVAVGAGLGLVAAGVFLYVTAPSGEQADRAARIVPMASPDSFGLAVVRGF